MFADIFTKNVPEEKCNKVYENFKTYLRTFALRKGVEM